MPQRTPKVPPYTGRKKHAYLSMVRKNNKKKFTDENLREIIDRINPGKFNKDNYYWAGYRFPKSQKHADASKSQVDAISAKRGIGGIHKVLDELERTHARSPTCAEAKEALEKAHVPYEIKQLYNALSKRKQGPPLPPPASSATLSNGRSGSGSGSSVFLPPSPVSVEQTKIPIYDPDAQARPDRYVPSSNLEGALPAAAPSFQDYREPEGVGGTPIAGPHPSFTPLGDSLADVVHDDYGSPFQPSFDGALWQVFQALDPWASPPPSGFGDWGFSPEVADFGEAASPDSMVWSAAEAALSGSPDVETHVSASIGKQKTYHDQTTVTTAAAFQHRLADQYEDVPEGVLSMLGEGSTPPPNAPYFFPSRGTTEFGDTPLTPSADGTQLPFAPMQEYENAAPGGRRSVTYDPQGGFSIEKPDQSAYHSLPGEEAQPIAGVEDIPAPPSMNWINPKEVWKESRYTAFPMEGRGGRAQEHGNGHTRSAGSSANTTPHPSREASPARIVRAQDRSLR